MEKKFAFGLKFSIFNLLIVALLGLIMRYKIIFSFPYFNQNYLLEAHAHYAFYGWITFALYILIAQYLKEIKPDLNLTKYRNLILGNLIVSIGMLVSFTSGGYNVWSILFSVVALILSVIYFVQIIKDTKGIQRNSKIWFTGGLFFAVFSSIGVLALSYMMLNKHIYQDIYLAAQYFYLHFQYNGFFIFSCIGLLLHSLRKIGVEITVKQNKTIFGLLFIGCLVGYGLSILWAKLPLWFFIILIVATLLQTWGAIKLYALIKNNHVKIKAAWTPLQRFVLFYLGIAFTAKILLQLGSNIPAVSQFAFGFRNSVIAYLHLILLMIISVFLVNQIITQSYFKQNKIAFFGLKLFLLGIFLNELVLGLMGVFSIKYVAIPYAHESLVIISVLIFIAVLLILLNLKYTKTLK